MGRHHDELEEAWWEAGHWVPRIFDLDRPWLAGGIVGMWSVGTSGKGDSTNGVAILWSRYLMYRYRIEGVTNSLSDLSAACGNDGGEDYPEGVRSSGKRFRSAEK